jgi:hypothetical protein
VKRIQGFRVTNTEQHSKRQYIRYYSSEIRISYQKNQSVNNEFFCGTLCHSIPIQNTPFECLIALLCNWTKDAVRRKRSDTRVIQLLPCWNQRFWRHLDFNTISVISVFIFLFSRQNWQKLEAGVTAMLYTCIRRLSIWISAGMLTIDAIDWEIGILTGL